MTVAIKPSVKRLNAERMNILSERGKTVKKAVTAEQWASAYGGGGGYLDIAGTIPPPTIFRLMSLFNGLVFALSNLNAEGVAKTPLRLFVKNRKGDRPADMTYRTKALLKSDSIYPRFQLIHKRWLIDAIEVKEVFDSPIMAVLDKETGKISGYDRLRISQIHKELGGLSFWEIFPDTLGRPENIFILAPQAMHPKMDLQTGVITHYEFQTPTKRIRKELDNLLINRSHDPRDPYRKATSPAMAAYIEINLLSQYKSWATNTIQNKTIPSLTFAPGDKDGSFSEAQANELQRKLNAQFSGVNAEAVAVFRQKISMEVLAQKPKDMQLFAICEETLERIANIFGVPISKLKTENVNKANALIGKVAHTQDAIEPRLIQWENLLNSQFVPLFNDSGRFILAFDSPVPEDIQQTADIGVSEVLAGIKTPNERRKEMNLPPDPDGDKLRIPHQEKTGQKEEKPRGTEIVEDDE